MKMIMIFFISFVSLYAKAVPCRAFLGPSALSAHESVTENFITFVSTLIKEQKLSATYLHTLIKDINENKSITNAATILRDLSDREVFRDIFQAYADHEGLDKKQVKAWAEAELKTVQKTNEEKTESKEETKDAVVKMRFYKIKRGPISKLVQPIVPPGTTSLDNPTIPIPASIDYDFEMMNLKVTNHMWLKVMGSIPFDEGKLPLPPGVKREDLPFEADMAIQNINWWEAVMFANKLSELNGYPPAYDLSGIEFEAKDRDGSIYPRYWPLANMLMHKRIADMNIEKIYGYRLPTVFEQIFVNTKLSDKDLYNGFTEENIGYVAWYDQNSNFTNHPVAQLNGIAIDGHLFFDLMGHSPEFSHDWFINSIKEYKKLTAKPSQGVINPFKVSAHGAYSSSGFGGLAAGRVEFNDPADKSRSHSLRLVRTLP